ncbi:MAG: matrixin family metalloprotease [Chloroflexi bacterium]|nr:matrixin family metalloprotease [Chloroflexota bacterium]
MSNVDSYEIWERHLQNNRWSDWMKLPSLTPITTSAAYIPGLTNGVQYQHSVISKRGSTYSDWSDIVTTGLLHRQSDHVARFHLQNASSMSSDFRTAIPTAVAAWKTAITRHGHGNLGINICKKGAGNCNTQNLDGYSITVKSVTGNINNTNDVYDSRYAHYTDCGDKIACVKTTNPRTYGSGSAPVYNFLSYGTPLHLRNLTVIVEDPAYEVHIDSKMRVLGNMRVFWGNNTKYVNANSYTPSLCTASDIQEEARWCAWYYLPAIQMHEFGHALGLTHPESDNGVMDSAYNDVGPSVWDIITLGYRYERHTPTAR